MSTVNTIMLKFESKSESDKYLISKGWKIESAEFYKGKSDLDEIGVITNTLSTFTFDEEGYKIFDTEQLDGWHINIYTQCKEEVLLHKSLTVENPIRVHM